MRHMIRPRLAPFGDGCLEPDGDRAGEGQTDGCRHGFKAGGRGQNAGFAEGVGRLRRLASVLLISTVKAEGRQAAVGQGIGGKIAIAGIDYRHCPVGEPGAEHRQGIKCRNP